MNPHVELVVGQLRGYRWWRIGPAGWLLSPWRGRLRWDPHANRAECLFRRRLTRWQSSPEDHALGPPVAGCDCGFYGLHAVPLLRDRMVGFSWEIGAESSGARHGLVFGVAAASGRVVLGTEGWRSEYARPMALLWGVETDGRLDLLVRRYGVPVYRSLDALAEEWGPDQLERDLLAS